MLHPSILGHESSAPCALHPANVPHQHAPQPCEKTARRLVPSVVRNAGIGDYACVKGRSGRRYVFSAIQPGQRGLYDNAIFATLDAKGAFVLSSSGQDTCSPGLYVHILEGPDKTSVMSDLDF